MDDGGRKYGGGDDHVESHLVIFWMGKGVCVRCCGRRGGDGRGLVVVVAKYNAKERLQWCWARQE